MLRYQCKLNKLTVSILLNHLLGEGSFVICETNIQNKIFRVKRHLEYAKFRVHISKIAKYTHHYIISVSQLLNYITDLNLALQLL